MTSPGCLALLLSLLCFEFHQNVYCANCVSSDLLDSGIPQDVITSGCDANSCASNSQFNMDVDAGQTAACIGGNILPPSHAITDYLCQDATRRRRSIFNFTAFPEYKWDVSKKLKYKINWTKNGNGGTLNKAVKKVIKQAINDLSQATCVNFKYKKMKANINTPHLLFNASTGCISFSGMSPDYNQPQLILVDNDGECSYKGGISLLLLHTLGFWHEHMRPDRDEYVDVDLVEVQDAEMAFFMTLDEGILNTYGDPYDLTSITHFKPTQYAAVPGSTTIYPDDTLFGQTIGQRVKPSFWDIKKINQAYCADACTNSPLTCIPPGYNHPRDCNICVCPDGCGGVRCQWLEDSHPQCSLELQFATWTPKSIQSPKYGVSKYNTDHKCTWYITPKSYCSVKVWFVADDDFGIFAKDTVCYHWVEIKTATDKSLNGYRFCGDSAPTYSNGTGLQLKSEGNFGAIMVIFKAIYSESADSDFINFDKVGFKLYYSRST